MIGNNLIMMNRYCNDLHDDNKIIFCKIDLILSEFKKISEINHNVVLIIANGDKTFDDRLLSLCPSNVKHIFATNTTCYNDKVTPIPIGVEISIPCKRIGHGDVNPGIFEKIPYLIGDIVMDKLPKNNKIYSNFNTNTNVNLRTNLKKISLNESHINFEYGVTYPEFVQKVQSHIGTLSPRGNGIECVRTYEILYLNSIPIIFGDSVEYKAINEKIYKNLPIVFIDNEEKLKNFLFIEKEISKVKNNSLEMLDYNFWVEFIEKKTKKLL